MNFELYQNYPNPFNNSIKIGFKIEKNDMVTLNIYNSLSRKITKLIHK